jgi:quinol-cytochrome oxidoreductase complex cytochrome b subunit
MGSSRIWACKIVTGVPAAVPIVGPPLVLILRGVKVLVKVR